MLPIASALLLCLAAPAAPEVRAEGAELVFHVRGTAPGDGFGLSAATISDVDGDEVPDLAVGVPVRGLVRFVSGSNGATISHHHGGPGFGARLDHADVDGDGELDLLAGPVAGSSGARRIFSGQDGTQLPVAFAPGTPADRLGDPLARRTWMVGDADNDGHADRAEPFTTKEGQRAVKLRSGVTGDTLATLVSDRSGDAFGWSVADAGDVNGDGHADVIVGAPSDDSRTQDAGAAWIFSGSDGHVLAVIRGAERGSRLGTLVGTLGDTDGDGADEIWVTSFEGADEGAGTGVLGVYKVDAQAELDTDPSDEPISG